MYSAQRVSARNANIYLPFDRQFADGGVQVTGNCGGKAPRPQYCTMGDGVTAGTFPTQLDTRRGVSFSDPSTEYMTVPSPIVDDEPFSLVALVSNLPRYAASLFTTLDPNTAVGVYLIVTQSTIEMLLNDGAGGMSAHFTVLPSDTIGDKKQTSIVVAYDGSGNASGLTLFLDGKLLPWTSASGSLAGTIVSGLDVLIAADWMTVAPDPVTVSPYFDAGIIHTVAIFPFALTEHMAGILDARMRAEIHVLEDAKYTPV